MSARRDARHASKPTPPTPQELADFYWRRTAFPGAVWAGLVLMACLTAWLEPASPPASVSAAGHRGPSDVASAGAFTTNSVTDAAASRAAAAPPHHATPSIKEQP